ncbi:MAG: YybH family protein [Pyrinomonadaceae bacterium]
MKKHIALVGCIALLAFALACQPQTPATAPDTRAADEAAIREFDEQWSKAASDKNLDKMLSYYADDALVLQPNGPMVNTKQAIRKIWSDTLTAPGFSGGWRATKVEVAKSGEIGYASGTWEFTWNDASGKPVTDRGKFIEVVKKQADGTWKCTVDIWNSDLPLPAPSETK